jgi:outer membrane protein assembly factor BamB
LLCCDRETGHERWRFTECDMVFGKPAVDALRVYLGSRDTWCYCLDRRDGRVCWKVSLGSPVWASPALCEGRLYLVPSGGLVTCLDAGAGTVLWTFDLAAYTGTKPQMLSSPTVVPCEENGGGHHWIYFGAELTNSVNSAAVLYCLRD